MPAQTATEVYDEAFRAGLKPDPPLTISEWADRYRRLSGKAAAEPGPWRAERTPYLREIMNSLSPSAPVERVVFMKGSQIGGTECGNNWVGYVIHKSPGPVMVVQPTVELATRNSKQRIDPLIEESEVLRELVKSPRSRDSGNTVLSKEFPSGFLVMTGANGAVGLRSMAVRYLFLDEIDAYPGDVDGEGDPINLVRPLCGREPAQPGTGQAGNVRSPRVHALLWENAAGETSGRTTDIPEAQASDLGRDSREALPAAARTHAWRVAPADPDLNGYFAAPRPAAPAQLVPLQSTRP